MRRPQDIRKIQWSPTEDNEEFYDADEINLADISLEDALTGFNATEWMQAVKEEFKALIKNETWEIVNRPSGGNIIGCRFVLRNKMKENGALERRKARLVARGFAQRYGVEFTDTFAPVARMSSIRVITNSNFRILGFGDASIRRIYSIFKRRYRWQDLHGIIGIIQGSSTTDHLREYNTQEKSTTNKSSGDAT